MTSRLFFCLQLSPVANAWDSCMGAGAVLPAVSSLLGSFFSLRGDARSILFHNPLLQTGLPS